MLKGLGQLGNMGNMLRQVMELKEKMVALREELGQLQTEGSAGGGMVTVTITGKMEVVGVRIDPEIIDASEPGMLETLVQAAMNDAVAKAQEQIQTRTKELTGGLDLPVDLSSLT